MERERETQAYRSCREREKKPPAFTSFVPDLCYPIRIEWSENSLKNSIKAFRIGGSCFWSIGALH